MNSDLEPGSLASSRSSNGSKQQQLQQVENTGDLGLTHIKTEGPDNEFIYLGNHKYRREELAHAFGGTLVPGIQEKSAYQFGNSVPLGLCAYSISAIVLCLVNVNARSVSTPNIMVGLGFFYSGVVMFSCAMWQFACNNTFGATVLGSFCGFWLSYSAILTPAFGIQDAYETTEEFNNALGFYLLCWTFFVFMITLTTLKSTWVFFIFFIFVDLLFLLLTISAFIGSLKVQKAAGVFGILSGFLGFYIAYAGIADPQNSYFVPHPIGMPDGDRILFSRKH